MKQKEHDVYGQESSHFTIDTRALACTNLAVGADTEWVEQVHRNLTGIEIPQHDNGHAFTAALPPAMQDLFGGGV